MMQNEGLSARRFTDSAVRIVEQLWPRAMDRGMSSEVTEQTVPMLALWSVLRWERKVGLVALERNGVNVDALACDVDRAIDAACGDFRRANGPPQVCGVVVDFLAPLAPLLETAERESLSLGHDWVGSEHLVLALIRIADLRLKRVLEQHGVAYDAVRKSILEILQC